MNPMIVRVDTTGPVVLSEVLLPAVDFVDFYHDARPRVARALALTLGDLDLAVEATDEAFVRAFQRWGRVSRMDNPGGWAYRVGLNWATSVLRRRGRAPTVADDEGGQEPKALPEPDVMRALAELDVRQRAVVVCRCLLGWSEADTAAALRTPATAATSTPSRFDVAWSADGAAWQRGALNLDLATIFSKATSNGTEVARAAAGPAGVLVALTVNATVDLRKVLPAGAPSPSSWAATSTGVALLRGACPAPTPPDIPGIPTARATPTTTARGTSVPGNPVLCYDDAAGSNRSVVSEQALGSPTASYTWAQLGISGDAMRAVLDEPFGFLSTDGSTFHPVLLPASPGAGSPDIVAGPAGFALIGADRVTTINGQLSSLWQSANGRDWAKAPPVPDPFDFSHVLGTVGGHYAVAHMGPAGAELETLVGDHWATARLDQLAKAPSGQGLGMFLQAAFGPLGVAVVLEYTATNGGTNANVLFSPDGVAWSSRPLSDIAGGQIGQPTSVAVTASQVLVVAPKGPAQPSGVTRPSITLVGTPG